MSDKPFRDITQPPGHAAGHHPTHHMADTPAAVPQQGSMQEAVGLFSSEDRLQKAIDELSMAGFFPHDLSLMANDESVLRRVTRRGDLGDIAHNAPDNARRAVVAPEEIGNAQGAAIGVPAYIAAVAATGVVVATGGTALAAAAAAIAAGGAGGGLGALLARWIGNKRNAALTSHLEGGGMLLWVNLRDEVRERQACEIIARHADSGVEVHDIA
ncbi:MULTISPECIES: hypothetical protein [unclassified Azospirillum]|uniref:hypothetical protein n=1 Tax=unclassified Azospirillum TaxID=2630922 RepID=UPI000B6BA7DB|nr:MULTISPECIES: hypothetical protein [unclassified Azospirillum]SNS17268.1 hypothetical protein SAMN05880556_102305 [Azospirillum sp. RU38E]SNS34582.1 hypothetical protein SAMN05880591_102305 [Azospirillum sp. RU37A]